MKVILELLKVQNFYKVLLNKDVMYKQNYNLIF